MLIRQKNGRGEWQPLAQAGTITVAHVDMYGVKVEGQTIDANGDPLMVSVSLTGNELALIWRAYERG